MSFHDHPADLSVRDLDPDRPIPAGFAVLDVREQEEWDAGHVAGAVHIPLAELPERIEELPEEELLVVCRSGGRSAQAAAWLNHSGYDARNLQGGLKSWEASGLPLTSHGPPPAHIL